MDPPLEHAGVGHVGFVSYTPDKVASRNLRNVWRIATKGYPGSHYATFPLDLVVPCIKASTPEKGVCPECGAPWARVIEKPASTGDPARGWDTGPGHHGNEKRRLPKHPRGDQKSASGRVSLNVANARKAGADHDNPFPGVRTIGWRPTCSCGAGEGIPATVLDPYGGSGTTAEAAVALGRNCILVDLDPRNRKLMRKRLQKVRLGMK